MTNDNMKIDRKAERIYGLTPVQEGMLFRQMVESETFDYFLQSIIEAEGVFDPDLYKKAVYLLSVKHEMLRCLVAYRKVANPIAIIVKERMPEICYYDISEEANQEKWLQAYKENDKKKSFDLEKDTLFRSAVVRLTDTRYIIIWSFHHIIVDGWSIALLLEDFERFYSQMSDGMKEEILHKEILGFLKKTGNFEQHVKWIKSRNLKEGIAYWKKYLANYEGNTQILPMQQGRGRKIAEECICIPAELYRKLTQYARKNEVTMNVLAEAALSILLRKYSGDDVVYGKVISGRSSGVRNIENVVGLFINTIPQRITFNEGTTFSELVGKIRSDNMESEQFGFCSLAEIQKETIHNGSLIQVLYAYENYMDNIENQESKGNIKFIPVEENEQTEFDLTFCAYEEDVLCFDLEYNSISYNQDAAERILSRLVKILEVVIDEPESMIADHDFLLNGERDVIAEEFNISAMEAEKDKTIITLFEEQVRKTPHNTALIFGDEKMTYQQMDNKVNVLANKLRSRGIKEGDFVAIMAVRSIEMILGIYAVLKSGAAYVPIDPAYPEERIQYILKDCCPMELLLYGTSADYGIPVTDLGNRDTWEGNETVPVAVNNQEDPVYVIYTSGTTGKPKGVVNLHGGLFNLLKWMGKEYPIVEKDAVLFKTTYVFDVSVSEIFWWCTAGARLVILGAGEEKESSRIINAIEKYKVSVIDFAPSMLSLFINEAAKDNAVRLRSLKYIIAAGEALNVQLANSAYKMLSGDSGNQTLLANLYGPTEASIYSTYYNCRVWEEVVPIGKPIGNVKLYILDRERLCGIGIPGELCIAGAGLARGYLNLDSLTEEKFIKNPFGPGRLYRTGDLARWNVDGNVEYLGRIDDQVKIRGFRIELGEIASALRRIDIVNDCAVIVLEDPSGDKSISAYLVGEEKINQQYVREKLSESLPEYMIPSCMMQIDKIPVTGNGKLDKRALPVIEIQSQQDYVAPGNEVEKLICELFQDILNVARVGVKDSFFELGGHSLKVTRLINRLETKTGVKIPVKKVFNAATPEKIARLLKSMEANVYEAIPAAEKKELYMLTSMQKRIYLLSRYDKNSTVYNMPQLYRINGCPDVDRMKIAFAKLIQRHDILRTEFVEKDGMIYQKIRSEVSCPFEYYLDATTEEVELLHIFCRPFELNKAPLVRLCLIKRTGHYLFLLDIHHIICDGESIELLLQEFAELYNDDKSLPQAKQYIDYSEWMGKRELDSQKKFWLEQFEDEIPVCNIPTDFTRRQGQEFYGAVYHSSIDGDLFEAIRKFIYKYDITEYMFFLSAISILLTRYGYQEEIIIGTPAANRVHSDTEKMLGMFVNTLAIRLKPERDILYLDYLEQVKKRCMQSYENQEYPFDELVNSVDIVRDLSRNPLFDVMYAFQNMEDNMFHFSGFTMEEISHDYNIAKFDMTYNITQVENSYNIDLEYRTCLYSRETVQHMMEYLFHLVQSLVSDPFRSIGDYEINNAKDRKRILSVFNATYADYCRSGTVVSEFEKIVLKYPEQTAIKLESEHISYGQLNKMANSICNKLSVLGVKRGNIVAMCCERGIEMIAGILGIMKAGGAYLPIDPNYPVDRVNYLLEDASPSAVLVKGTSVETELPVLDLSGLLSWDSELHNPERLVLPTDMAYVIYTSGTTGNPKGVMIEHKGILSMASFLKKKHELDMQDCILQFANYVFDASVWEIMMALLNGASLAIMPEQKILSLQEFNQYVEECKVTHTLLPPYYYLQTDLRGLKTLTTGGSASNEKILEKAVRTCRYINAYGPTENTVLATYWLYEEHKDKYDCIPIGKPIDNTQIYIMNHNSLCGIGVPGELCIAGEGVARGYLNQPELTRKKFVKNLFGEGKMYRSGDLARWLPDGNIEFLGRIDTQVKIRGFRIELGEIEHVIRSFSYIRDAVVITRKNNDNNDCLCAFIVSDCHVDMEQLRNDISEKLPEYMIPSFIMQVDTIPVTKSGKLNKKELPAADYQDNKYTPPRNDVEVMICNVMAEVLGLDHVGIYDNFFELGGDSIAAIRIVAKLRTEGFAISVKDILSAKKPVFLSKRVKNTAVTYSQQPISGFIVPTSVQDAFLCKWNLEEPEYFNQTMILRGENIRHRVAEEVLKEIVIHHDILRGVIREDKIYIREPGEGKYFDVYHIKTDNIDELKKQCESIQKSFLLSEGPLVKLVFILFEQKEYIMFCIHHLAVDIVSWNIIQEDFENAYRQSLSGEHIQLPLKTMSVVEWGNKTKLLGKDVMEQNHVQFWKEMLNYFDSCDFKEASLGGYTGSQNSTDIEYEMDEEYTFHLLHEVNEKYGTKTAHILLSALTSAVYQYTGNNRISAVIEEHGRESAGLEADISRTVGWFTNLYPVVLRYDDHRENIIIHVKELLNQVGKFSYEYSILPELNFFNILDADFSFNYLGIMNDAEKKQTGDLFQKCELDVGSDVSSKNILPGKFSLVFYVTGKKLICSASYNQKYYSPEFAKRFMDIYQSEIKNYIDYLAGKQEIVSTLSDIDADAVNQEELEELNNFVDSLQ